MELSALLCRILLAMALLTSAVTHQNANSLILSELSFEWKNPSDRLDPFSFSPVQVKEMVMNTGVDFTYAPWWRV